VKAPTLSNKNRYYALLAGNLVVLAAVAIFAVRPTLGLLVKRTGEIAQTKAEIAQLEVKTAELRKLKESYPTYAATYEPILQGLPKEKDTARYQTELDDLAAATTVTLTNVAFPKKTGAAAATPANAGSFPSVAVKVDISGTFATVYDFVQRLESLDQFTKVTSLSLTADNSGAVKASLDLQTFYLQ
jgi:Tfp pilus assembly protein PilO